MTRVSPPPYEGNPRRVVRAGIVLWLVALLCLLPFWSRLEDSGRLWWIATCALGVVLGFVGLRMIRRRDAAIARDARRDDTGGGLTT